MSARPIILYDGVCGLCNRLVQFLLKRDTHDRLRFASLQSDFAGELLIRHGRDATDLDTVYVVLDQGEPTERVLSRSDAIIHAVNELGGVWKLASAGKILPLFLRDAIYNVVAGNRYRFFGKYDTCIMPEEKYRKKFMEV